MQKLTQQQASELISRAWKQVSEQNLGSYRFGQSLWDIIPPVITLQYWNVGSGYLHQVDFYYEQNTDIVIEKFYKYFVEDSNN